MKLDKHLGAVLEVDAGLQAPDLELTPHDLLGHAHAERAVADDEVCGLERSVDDVAVGDDARHESDAVGFGRIDQTSGQQAARTLGTRRSGAAASTTRRCRSRRGRSRTNATLKRAVAAAMRTSLASASARPPPDAAPFTAAMIGWGIDRILGTSPAISFCTVMPGLDPTHVLRRRRVRLPRPRSRPAQNPRPAPVSTITRHAGIGGELVEACRASPRRERCSSR